MYTKQQEQTKSVVRVHLVGVDHFLQSLTTHFKTQQGIESEAAQKKAFEGHLRKVIETAGIDFIAEEARMKEDSIGGKLAAEYNCQCRTVTMPDRERQR